MSLITRAVLGAAIAAVAIPGAAEAATLQVDAAKTKFTYTAAPGETNTMRVSQGSDGTTFIDDTVPIQISGGSALDGCRLESDGDAVCAPNVEPTAIDLGDRNDTITYTGADPITSGINAGDGNDTVFAGIRRGPLGQAAPGVLVIAGGAGTADKVSYEFSQFEATASLDDQANDGTRVDAQNVRSDVEVLEGSSRADTLVGSTSTTDRETFIGGNGNDTINGLDGTDIFDEGAAPNGADTYNGASGIDLIDYSKRPTTVNVSLDASRNDGAPGEADFVDPNVNDVFGGQGVDSIVGSSGPNTIRGFGSGDVLNGLGGNDVLDGGTGVDTLLGDSGDDTLEAADNTPDVLRCGTGVGDTLNRDLSDVDARDCERVNSVGTLRLAPKTIKAEAGEATQMQLSWRHPVRWQNLRTVELRLTQAGASVGEVTIRPNGRRLAADGGIELVGSKSRLTTEGKTVTARLAVRLDEELAGQTLRAEVEATDKRGARQLSSDAATVVVAP